jgi:uncharacterized membrane protein
MPGRDETRQHEKSCMAFALNLAISPLIGLAVCTATAVTEAVYVVFNAAVGARQRIPAADWSGL